ncbi:MAG: choice-of-anchor M domain-containing protein [Planctomycetota bacterium]
MSPANGLLKVASRVALAVCLAASSAEAVSIYSNGHSDIALLHELGTNHFDFIFRFDTDSVFEDGNTTFAGNNIPVTEAAIRVPEPTVLRSAPFDTSEWDFLGVPAVPPGDTSGDGELWFISQGNDPARPFMGIATETLNPSAQWNGDLTYTLEAVLEGPEGGEVAVWQQDSNGDPIPYFSTVEGADVTNELVDQISGHDHYNWTFSEPGVYRLLIGASAVHVQDGLVQSSDVLTFVVGGDTALTPDNSPGDFNGDGVVDAADFTVWRDNLGATEDGLVLGGNGDGGQVDNSDYLLWRGLFGTQYPAAGSASTSPTPEPSTAALSGIGLLGLSRRGRRRH